jgi:hypothetical protein
MKVGYPHQMGTPQFKVEVTDYSISMDEWRRAHSAPNSELPNLNEIQSEVAGKFGISKEEYARSVLAGRYGVHRLRKRTTRLGEEIDKILLEVSPGYRVSKVIAEMFRERWLILIRTSGRDVGVSVPRELGDDFLDSGAREAAEELKARVTAGLGLGERGVPPR